jgi:signal transduction histidine kinase
MRGTGATLARVQGFSAIAARRNDNALRGAVEFASRGGRHNGDAERGAPFGSRGDGMHGGPAGGARRADLLLALALTVAGLAEVLLGPADGRLVRALAAPLATLPLAVRRSLPAAAPAGVAVSLLVSAAFGDFFDAAAVTPLVAMLVALYSAGRHAGGAAGLAFGAAAAATLAATRIAFDPAVDDVGAAALTALAVVLPLLVGRWARGQAALHREVAAGAAARERERERDARDAAEEERMRIAADLQAAVADRLSETVEQAGLLRRRLADGDDARARELLASIATAAREALADVRRVLGILRRETDAPPLAPPVPPPDPTPSPAVAAAPPHSPARAESSPAASAPPPSVADLVAPSSAPAAPATRTAAVARGLTGRRLDLALAAALLVAAVVEQLLVADDHRVFAVLSALAIVAPMPWRRAHPIATALASLAAVAVQSTVLEPDSFAVADAAVLISGTYAIGAYLPRRPAIAGIAVFAAGTATHAAVFFPDAVPAALLGAAAVPWTVGRIVRAQRRLVAQAREHAAQVERARERDARAAVIAERMRVARELHDVVAHNISVIAIQAAGADGVLERDRARAEECAALIEEVGRDAIAELRRLSGVPATTGPQPTLARVDALAQRARDGGLPVELHVEGDPARLAAGVDLAAFRIVQEALANASKHAHAGRAWVVVRYEPRAVELEIGDDGRGPQETVRNGTNGHGLVGMRERAALYGGTLDVGTRPEGGFSVRARLPLQAP